MKEKYGYLGQILRATLPDRVQATRSGKAAVEKHRRPHLGGASALYPRVVHVNLLFSMNGYAFMKFFDWTG